MKAIINLLFLLLLVLGSCKTKREVVFDAKVDSSFSQHQDYMSYSNRAIYVSDSAYIELLLNCDSLGKVYIAKIERLQMGDRIKPEVSLKDNILNASCKADSMLIYEIFASRLIVDGEVVRQSTIEQIEPPKKSGFELSSLFAWIGYIPLILIALYFIYRLIKIFRL